MRKLILFLLILSVFSVALHLTQRSQAAVSTTIAPAGTQLNAQDQFKWNYPVEAENCQRSNDVPYAHYYFDVTTSGNYTFTMTTSGFPGVIHIYSNSFNPMVPCQNLVNSAVYAPDQTSFYTAGSPLTISLNAPSGPSRYVVVFSPKNANTSGTFSASVSGPAAVTVVPNITTTIANAGTPLNSQNAYLWQYPITQSCSNTSGLVPFAAYTFQVPTTGLYTFTMNPSGFAGVVHLYQSGFFNPNAPCFGNNNLGDNSGNIITGSTIRIPISSAPGLNQYTVVFSPKNPGDSGTFSASVTGPSAVPLVPPGDLAIASQPHSKSVTSGCQQTLTVYATGPLSQTFQWYEGVAGDLSTSIMILQATSNTYITPPLTSDKSYWVRVTSGSDHVDSQTIAFKVYQNNKTQFSGSLDPNQTWKLMTTFCQPTSTFVHYSATQISVPADGNYTVHINRESDFTSGYAIHIYGSFDATAPCGNFWDVSVNSDLSTHLSTGTYTVVVSATSPSQITGGYAGTISTIDDCGLPETIEQALLISGNPLDKAISPGTSTTLTFAYIGGSNKLKTVQWYSGFSGDTSQPIFLAVGTNYVTPVLNQSPPNQPTYYYYWARVTDHGQGTHADTRTAVVNVLNPPVTYTDVLTQCDDVYPQVNGPTTFYKIFPFTVSTDGAYSFNVSASGFTPAVKLYQGFFSPNYPNINYYGPGTTQTIHAGPNIYYLVITTTAANQTGSFTLTINGPDLVVPTPRPILTAQPADQIILRNQTATLNVTSSTPDVSYQWYTGTCTNKTPVNGANTNSFTTPAMTDYQDYWVKVSYGVMYVNSNVAHVKIRPEAINDTYTTDEDVQLNTGDPGVMANDKKADSKTISAHLASSSSFGLSALAANGALIYKPPNNRNGTDSFTYTVNDGTLTSDPGTATIIVREINDPPVRTGGSVNDHTFTEDAAAGTLHLAGVSYGPGGGTDEADQTLTYKVTAVPPVSVGQVTLANNTTVVTVNTTYTLSDIRGMQFKPAANGYGGPYLFTFAVTDNGNSRGVADPQTLSQSLNITVTGVADTPPTTSATTNEDTQTTPGLVLNRNADDGAEVTHFQISQIKNGTLYKNDGVTQIDKGEFITYGEGHAGLKFKPNANLYSPGTVFSFDFQASLSNSGQGLGGSPVTATITVNPVADLPTVTGATTFANLQTNSGLVITRNQVDGSEIGFYKISSIANGTLYKADGTTQINAGQFITAAEGLAGLRFTPAQDSTTSGTFQIQGSVDSSGVGLGPAATANILVSKYDTLTTISSDSPAPSYLGQQITISYTVQNTSGSPVPDGDVVLTVSGGPETCTGTVAAGSCQLTLNAGGNPRTITATYGGNSQFNSSIGTKDHVVNGCTQNTTVTSTGDDGAEGTLRYIVDHACDGSTITFDPAVFNPANGPHNILLGTFGNIAENLLINKSLTIQGPGADILTVRRDPASRTKHFRIFNIASSATAMISGLTISNGFANGGPGLTDADGGGILNSGTLTLKDCVVSDNQAGRTGLTSGSGGGIYNSGALTLINSTINGNNAFIRNGGGILVESSGTANIVNSTISGNTAAGSGGGLAVSGSVNVLNSTIANNAGAVSAGGIFHEMGATSITNSIVAGNTSTTGPDVVLLSGQINTGGHNLIGKNDGAESAFVFGSPNTNLDIVGNSNSPILSLLGPLADNGGPTHTHLPLPGSPAINAGSNGTLPQDTLDTDGNGNTGEPLPRDQRGQSRIANTTVDIGAVEVSYAITSTSGAGQSAVINTSFATPLRATVTESGRAVGGTQVTFAGPGAGPGGSFNGNATVTVLSDNSGVAESSAFFANETAGNYDVSAGLAGGTASTTFGLTNTQGSAQVSLSNLAQTFDGTPRYVSVTTSPSGLAVVLAYDGSITPPTNAGSYQVTATINDPNYSGQTLGTLDVARANQTINFGALSNKTVSDAPFALSATATSGLPVSFNIVSGPASIAGNILTITGPGTVVVRASQTGDANNNPAPTADRSFDVNKIQAAITLGNLNQIYDGQAKNAVVTTNPPNLNILTVNYSQNGSVVAAPTNAGSYEVTASLSNDSYQSSDASSTLVIAKASQSISFDDLPNRNLGDSDFAVSASASSGLAVSLAASGNCIMASNTIHLTGAGTCTVAVSQDGNSNYLPAGSVSKSFSIGKSSAAITLGNLIHTYDGTAKALTVLTNPGGLNVTLTYDGSASPPASVGSYAVIATINDPNYQGSAAEQLVINKATPALTWSTPSDLVYGIALGATQLNATASVAGSFAYLPGAGTVLNAGSGQTLTVDFTPADAANYNTASKTVSLNVSKVNQTITFASLPNRSHGDGPFTLSATSSSGLEVSFSVIEGPATISGNSVSLSGAGSVTIRASQSGNDNNNAAAAVDRSFTISKANQTIIFSALPNRAYGDGPFTLGATSSSGLDVSFSVIEGPATISGNSVSLNGPGSVTIRASQSGDTNNNAATAVDRTFTVSKANQTITFAALPNRTYGDVPFTVSAASSSGLDVSFSVIDGPAAITGNSVSLNGAGSVTIRASQSGDNNNNAATAVDRSFTISKANQTITFAPLPNRTYGEGAFTLGATSSSGLDVSFSVIDGPAAISGNSVSLNGAGSVTIRASQSGDNNNNAATAVDRTFTVSKANQTITFAPLPNRTYGDGAFTLGATSSSGLDVSFSVIDGPAAISGNSVSLNGAGSVTIRASQSGDTNNNAATAVDRAFTISKANQTITFAPLPNRTYGDGAFTLGATSSSGLDVSFSVIDGPAAISGNSVSLNGAGSVAIRASQSGDTNNNAATAVDRAFTISKANQTITFAPLPNRTYGDGAFPLSATSSSGLDVSFSVVEGPVAITGNSVSLTGAGSVTIRASQAGDNNNNTATAVDRTFTVAKANQTITFAPLPERTYGDGAFTLSATSSSGLDVSFSVIEGPAAISGNSVSLSGAGSVTIRASQSGDNNNNAATAVDRAFTVSKANQTITFAPLPNRTYGDGAFTLGATSSSGLDVSFSVIEGPATISGNSVSLSGAGSVTIRASQSGDNNNNAATAVDRSFTISKANQTITFAPLPERTYGDGPFTLSATSSSGLDVSFSVIEGPATITGNSVSLSGAGSVTIRASQAGDNNNNAATAVDRTFTVAKANQTITFAPLPERTYGDGPFTLSATSSSGLDVSFSVIEGPATISGNSVSLSGAGSVTIRASQSGDNNNNAATAVDRSFTISKANQTITFAPLPERTYGDGAFTLSATSSSGLDVSFSVIEGPATITGDSVSLSGAGSVTIRASQSGDNNNNAAAAVDRSFTISKANQTITFAPLPERTYGDGPFTLSATSSSGLDVSLSVIEGPATISGDSVSLTGAGSVTIRASQSGDNNNNAAAAVDRSFTVSKANQTITFAPLPERTYGEGPFTLSATSSSGLDVSFSVIEGPATISGNSVSLSGAGSVTIRASQSGDTNNNAATAVDRTFTVAKANQTITFAALPNRTYGDGAFTLGATSSSGLDVSFSVIEGAATISGNRVSLTGAGSVTIRASQAGDTNNNAATAVDRTFTVSKANQTITFAALPNRTYGDGAFTLGATSSSGLDVSFSVIEGPATISGNSVSLSGAGSVTIRASQSGDGNNSAAAAIDRSFTVSKADQTISFGVQNDKTFGDADFALSATASSNLTVSFTANGNCIVTGTNVHLVGAGECTLTASQTGNDDYTAAPSLNQTFAIAKAATTTVVASSINPAGFGQPVTLTATVASAAGSPTGTVQFKDNETNLGTPATVNLDSTATFDVSSLSAGVHTIRAEYSGDANFIASNGLLPGGQSVGDNLSVIGFSASNYEVNESDGFIRIVVNRTGDAAPAITVDYATDDTGAPADCRALNSGLAFARCDFNAMFGRLTFAPNETQKTFEIPINMDSYAEGPEVFTITLSNLTSGSLAPASVTVTINDSPSSVPNASDDTTMFVRQQYHDFLNREPDAAGLAFWKNNIDKCNDPAQREPGQTLAQCIEVQRVVTSAAFFLSIEFRQTGGLVRDFYVAALDRPATNNLPALVEFARDTQRIQQGVIVGEGNWQQTLNENRASFMNDFVMRAEFVGLYPTTDSPAQYVDKLYQHAGVTPETAQERNQTIAEFGAVGSADDARARAEALLRVTQNSAFQAREMNRGFVQMEYFGYLRRNPNDAPDRDFAGYEFWLNKLNQFDGDFLKAEMVKAFVSSDEYRRRFGN